MTATRKYNLLMVCCFPMLFLFIFISNLYAIDLSSEEKEYLRTKDAVIFVSQIRYPPFEPKQRAHSPLLAAGLASELKTDIIPYGRRFPVACCGELQFTDDKLIAAIREFFPDFGN